MNPPRSRLSLIAAIAAGLAVVAAVGFSAGYRVHEQTRAPAPPAAFAGNQEPIPDTPFGRQAELGRRIFTDTARLAPQFVGNDLKCSNCHLDAGRLAKASPMWAAYPLFPQYRAKNGHVNTFAERLQGCFMYSMNGKAPPPGDPILVALESYSAWLAKGARLGQALPGRGYPKLAKPALAPDYARGQDVYAARCALCHGNDGAGQQARGAVVFPPVWGPRSYNWGAGMADPRTAAAFIKANMPYSQGGSLTDQQAWDVALYLDSQPRPQDPRYTGSLAETRKRFHDDPLSMYGRVANGVLLGGDGPPTGGPPAR
jgi:thiosulfate dehydrogenase